MLNLSSLISGLIKEKPSNILRIGEPRDYKCEFIIKGVKHKWEIELKFSEFFPSILPTAFLRNEGVIGTIPHVNQIGVICVEVSDTVIIDYHNPLGVLVNYLSLIRDTLDSASYKISYKELTDEIEGFLSNKSKGYVDSYFISGTKVEELYLTKSKKNHNIATKLNPIFLQHKDEAIPNDFSNFHSLTSCTKEKIIHIPLVKAVVPISFDGVINQEFLNEILNATDNYAREKVSMFYLKAKKKKFIYFLLSMPRTKGFRTEILFKVESNNLSTNPFEIENGACKVSYYLTRRVHPDYLTLRGCACNDLSNINIAIVGVGSVGGEIAFQLAKSGLRKLVLVDNDSLDADNIYRHRLGGGQLSFSPDSNGVVKKRAKVLSLRLQLSIDFPDININQKVMAFSEFVKDKDYENIDLFIVAVGSPAVSIEINRILSGHPCKKAIFSWNEADGVGGHAVFVDYDNSCFECTKCNNDGFAMISKDIDFVEAGQSISKNLTGCGGDFTPFSYLDSVNTASLATEQVLAFYKNDGETDYCLSWKTSKNPRIKTTKRFYESGLKEKIKLKRSKGCKVCNNG